MKTFIPLLLAPLILSSHAEQIEWTATGSVTSVSGSGFTATNGDPLAVKFSYDLGATPQPISGITGWQENYGFYGSIALAMEVTIGENTWKGSVASVTGPPRATYPLHTLASAPFIPSEAFTVTATSTDAAVFAPFPYAGAATDKSIQVILRDGSTPSNFLDIGILPSEITPTSEITSASGSITAGSDSIQFSIDPLTVSVTTDAPKFPLKISRTLTGIELRWPSEVGVNYQLQDSDTLSGGWQFYGSYSGTGSDIVVTLNPFDANPERRFYRVTTH